MNKEKIIKDSRDFTKIIKQNKGFKNKYLSIYYNKSNKNKYGITIKNKYGKAHERNKIKRQLKNIIILNEKNIPNSYNYVIIIKEACKELNYQGLEKELLNIIKKVGN